MSKADWVFSLKNDPRAVVRTLAEGIEASIFPGEQDRKSTRLNSSH